MSRGGNLQKSAKTQYRASRLPLHFAIESRLARQQHCDVDVPRTVRLRQQGDEKQFPIDVLAHATAHL